METVGGKGADAGLLRDYLSEEDLARELDVAKKTLHRWDREGRGPKRTKLGRRVLYSRAAVREWLSACERDPHQRDRRNRRKARA